MLIRMNPSIRTRLAYAAGIVLALFAGTAIAAGSTQGTEGDQPKVAIVVAGAAATDKAALASAHAVVETTGAELRVVHRNADQLGVMHMLAARGYDTVVAVGVDRRSAIAPVVEKYPHTRFVAAKANGLGRAMSGA